MLTKRKAETRTKGLSINKVAYNLGLIEYNGSVDLIVHRCTRVTNPKGNYRYHEFLLQIDKGVVLSIYRVKCTYCMDKKRVIVYDECPHCYGDGCTNCDNGLIKSNIRCQDCK